MPNTPIGRDEFETLLSLMREHMEREKQDLKETIGHGFSEITRRLDVMNGTQREHGNRITALETIRGRVDIGTLLALLAILVAIGTAFFP